MGRHASARLPLAPAEGRRHPQPVASDASAGDLQSTTMPRAYFALLVREFGLSASAALTSDGEGDRVTVGEQLLQLRELGGRLGPGWGLRMGAGFDASAHGPVGVAAMAAPRAREAVGVLARYGHLRTPFLRLSIREDDGGGRLLISPHGELRPDDFVPLAESTLVSVSRLLARVAGEDASSASVSWSRPAWAAQYGRFFRSPVRFAAPVTSLWLPQAVLDRPSPLADLAMYRSATDLLDRGLRRARSDDAVVERVERILDASGWNLPSLDDVASVLHLSARTLERRLDAAGRSFRVLADTRRRDGATVLLADEDLSVAEISHRLGYADPANFGRACRRWFGVSPRAYRDELRGARRSER
jgi:AraC-like DNA-binding protein